MVTEKLMSLPGRLPWCKVAKMNSHHRMRSADKVPCKVRLSKPVQAHRSLHLTSNKMTRAQQAWYRRPAGKVSLKAAKFAEKLLSSCRTLMSAALSPAVSIVAALERLWSVKTKSAIRVKRPRLRHGKVGSNVERLENCDDESRASHTTTGRKGFGKDRYSIGQSPTFEDLCN